MSRADLVRSYLDALPFAPIAVVALSKGSCRVETAASVEAIATYYFKASHIELVLSVAGLVDGRTIDQGAVAVAALIRETARNLDAPFQTAAQVRADAESEVNKILERVRTSNASGGLKQVNRCFRTYRQRCLAAGTPALPYQAYIQPFVVTILRQIAASGRMVG